MRLWHESNPSLVQELHHNHSQQFLFHLEGSVLAQPRGVRLASGLCWTTETKDRQGCVQQSSISVLLIVTPSLGCTGAQLCIQMEVVPGGGSALPGCPSVLIERAAINRQLETSGWEIAVAS